MCIRIPDRWSIPRIFPERPVAIPTNMDFLSLLNNDEVNAVILNQEFAVEMENMFARDLADSRQIDREEWKNRPWLPRLREWFVNKFDRWL